MRTESAPGDESRDKRVPVFRHEAAKGGETMILKPYFWFLRKREEGQTMAEYAVVLGVITLAVVGVFTALAGGISGAIDSVKGAI
jgi:Flp pilus assembly pilin Flp